MPATKAIAVQRRGMAMRINSNPEPPYRKPTYMHPPTKKTHAQELKEVLDKVHELKRQLAKTHYLSQLNFTANIFNIQMLLPEHVETTIASERITFHHTKLGKVFVCTQDQLPEMLKHTEWLHAQFSDPLLNQENPQ
jgi:hypothetical protein